MKKTVSILLSLLVYVFSSSNSLSEPLKMPGDLINDSFRYFSKDQQAPLDADTDMPLSVPEEHKALFNLKEYNVPDASVTLPVSVEEMENALFYLRELKVPETDIDFPISLEKKYSYINPGDNIESVKMIMFIRPSQETSEKLVFDFGKNWDQEDKRNFKAIIHFKDGKVTDKQITYDGYLNNLTDLRKNITK